MGIVTPVSTRHQRWTIRRREYPTGWRAISKAVRLRAGNRCEHCGAIHRWFHPLTGRIVFLQAAHMDHDHTNPDMANLKALCQRCHLIYDATLHATTAYATRREGRALGDLFA